MPEAIKRTNHGSFDHAQDVEHYLAIKYEELQAIYRKTHTPVEVSFRDLVHWLPYSNRATHFLHPYPAKLLFHIPYFFLNNRLFCTPSTHMLDPFCGSGTTLVEARLAGVSALGIDINPFAVFLANAKLSDIDHNELIAAAHRVCQRAARRKSNKTPEILNSHCWYEPATLVSLARLRDTICREPPGACTNALQIALSLTSRTLSLADPRMPVPVRAQPERFPEGSKIRELLTAVTRRAANANATDYFRTIVEQMAARFKDFSSMAQTTTSNVSASVADTRGCDSLANAGLVDLIITSPPYCGAQKYIRSSSLALGWLGLATPKTMPLLERQTIGREHIHSEERRLVFDGIPKNAMQLIESIYAKNPTRAAIASAYLREMKLAISNMTAVVRKGGHAIIIIGDSRISGLVFPTGTFIRRMFESHKCKLVFAARDKIRSRGLLTKRRSDASVITHEWVFVFRKGA